VRPCGVPLVSLGHTYPHPQDSTNNPTDKAANYGGVAVSGPEMGYNSQRLVWACYLRGTRRCSGDGYAAELAADGAA
jgi:hypothetical protein